MKKLNKILVIGMMIFSVSQVFGQKQYDKGGILVNAGIGLGYYYAGGVPLIASVEWAINDAIHIGPYIGYTRYNYNYTGFTSRYTFLDLGVRGEYHFSNHLRLSTDQLDLYGGANLGYAASTYSDNSGTSYTDPYGSTVRAGIFAGVRWYFSDKFAVNGEVGYGITPLFAGVSWKL
jgi:hypothetical protein